MMDPRKLTQFILRTVDPLRRRIILLCSRISLTKVDDSKPIQIVNLKALADEQVTNLERMQEFGFSSNPPIDGSEGVAVFIAGDRSNGFVIKTENRTYRILNLAEGEAVMYSKGGKMFLAKNTSLLVGSKSSDEPLVLGGVLKDLLSDMLESIATHTHLGNLGFPTGIPDNVAEFTALKASPVDDGDINSDIAFTEKG